MKAGDTSNELAVTTRTAATLGAPLVTIMVGTMLDSSLSTWVAVPIVLVCLALIWWLVVLHERYIDWRAARRPAPDWYEGYLEDWNTAAVKLLAQDTWDPALDTYPIRWLGPGLYESMRYLTCSRCRFDVDPAEQLFQPCREHCAELDKLV